MASREAIKAGEAVVELSLDDKKFNSSLAGMKAKFRQVVSSMRELVTISAGVSLAMVPVISTYTKFDDALLALRAVSGATAGELDLLKSKALELGQSTSFTAGQVARLMVELSKSGFKPDAIEDVTVAILNLSRATETDLTMATEIYLDTYKSFQLSLKDATRLADALTVAANSSSVSVTDLGFSLKYASPVAQSLGVSLEDTLAILAMYGDIGIKGEMAGTTLRRMFTEVAAGGKSIKQIFGVEVSDASGNVRPLVDVMSDIGDATRDLTQTSRVEKFKEFFQILGITGATAFADRVTEVRRLRGELNGLDGNAAKTAKLMDSGLGGTLLKVRGALEATAIAIGEILVPALTGAAVGMRFVTGMVSTWIKENRKLATAIGIVATALIAMIAVGLSMYVVVTAFTGLAAIATIVVVSFKLILASILMLFSPLGLITVFVGGLIAVFLRFSETGKRIGAELVSTFRRVGAIFGEMFDGVAAAMRKGDLNLAWDIVLAGMYASWLEVVHMLRKNWYDFTNYFQNAFENATTGIARVLVRLVNGIRVAFFNTVISIIDGLNKAHALVNTLINGKETTLAINGEWLPSDQYKNFKNTPQHVQLSKTIDDEKRIQRELEAYRERERKKINQVMFDENGMRRANPDLVLFNDLTNNIKLADEKLAASQKYLEALYAEYRKQFDALAIGDKFIDTTDLQRRRDAIQKQTDDIVAQLENLAKEEKEAREKGQKERLAQIKKEQEEVLARMRELIERAKKVDEEMRSPEGLPFGVPIPATPMLAPDMLPNMIRYADSAKGLFQSADYQQSLGIGGPNKAAEDAYRELQSIHGTLKEIRDKVGPAEFQ